jgi:hypothetical protein
MPPSKPTLILHNRWALGDTVCLSALVRDIARAYPGKYQVYCSGHYRNVFWRNNPYCQPLPDGASGQLVNLEYLDGIRAAGSGLKVHFLSWFHRDFERKVGIKVPVTEPKGDIHLSPAEKEPILDHRYWVVVAGGKMDMTAKVWYAQRWQEVIDTLADQGIRCVQAGGDFHRHFHPRLHNCTSMVGKTNNERDFFRLIYHADGVLCGVTAAMHIAAVFDKPCVVVAGGREEPWWEAYTNCYYPTAFGDQCAPVKVEHTFLHTLGLLDCGVGNLTRGCWKDRVVPIEQADYSNARKMNSLCRRPVRDLPQSVPECLAMITVDHVVEAVMNYYEKGILPPIAPPRGTYRRVTDAPPTPDPSPTARQGEGDGSAAAPAPATDRSAEETPRQPAPAAWSPPLPKEFQQPPPRPPGKTSLLDHPFIGGKFTVCILLYGDYPALAQRCLGSILDHTPPGRLDIRVAANQVSRRTWDYLNGFTPATITRIYPDWSDPNDPQARKKYPAMREMFWDDTCPITTSYVIWFDDDSHVVSSDWLDLLAERIVQGHPHGCRLYGPRYVHDLMYFRKRGYHPEKWFQQAPWWRQRWLHMERGTRLAPNGSQIVFATGSFWALATEAIRAAHIPDQRLVHNGGDICIGAQVHQAGFKLADFSSKKWPVAWSDAPPRGTSQVGPGKKFPWGEIP